MQHKAIIVIGMHRSGTSAISGLLAELGVFMGSSLFAAQKGVNEKGFYENSLIVEVNEELFDDRLWSWDDPMAECFSPSETSVPDELKDKANLVLKKDYSDKPLWGMKDPRTTLLLPFWQETMRSLRIKPTYILMIRPPMEVYGSLKKRDGFSLEKSLMLWMNYTLSGYLQSHGETVCIQSYHDLLQNPEAAALRIAEVAGLDIDKSSLSLEFVDQKLRNQKQTEVPEGELPTLANALYDALTQQDVVHEDVLAIAEKYSAYQSGLSAVLKEHIRTIKEQEVYFRTEFLDAYESVWWKIAWPIKQLEKIVRTRK